MKASKVGQRAAKWAGCGAVVLTLAACSSDKTPPRQPTASAANLAPGTEDDRVTRKDSETTVQVSSDFRRQCQIPETPAEAPAFDYDQATLRPRGANILDDVAKCLIDGPLKDQTITIIGRTDPRGPEQYNQELGASRASAARNYLISRGVSADHVRLLSRGEQEAQGTSEATWALDRRVDLELGDRTARTEQSPIAEGMKLQAQSAANASSSDGEPYADSQEGGRMEMHGNSGTVTNTTKSGGANGAAVKASGSVNATTK